MPIRKRLTFKSAAPLSAKAAVAPKVATPKRKEAKILQSWYSSEDAKRSLGFICRSINEQGETIGVLGSLEEPQLHMIDVDLYVGEYDEVIALDEVRANWPAVTLAAAIMGTRFRIDGRKQPRVALIANLAVPHPSLRFRRPQSPGAKVLAERLEEVLKEIRRLDNRIGTPWTPSVLADLVALSDRMNRSADIIERRFREAWRSEAGMSFSAN